MCAARGFLILIHVNEWNYFLLIVIEFFCVKFRYFSSASPQTVFGDIGAARADTTMRIAALDAS